VSSSRADGQALAAIALQRLWALDERSRCGGLAAAWLRDRMGWD